MRFLLVAVLCGAQVLGPMAAASAQEVTVKYRVDGFNFGPYIDGQDPNLGAVLSEEQIRDRLELVAPYTRWIRVFGSTRGLEHIGRIAHELGLMVACSAWLGRNSAANDEEVAAVIVAGQQGHCDTVIVGSEVLLRNDLSEAQLLAYIAEVKTALPALPVTTADVYTQLLAHPAVIAAVDLVLANYYPYWEGIVLKHAVASLHRAHQRVVAAAGGKPVWVSEAGWPSCGDRKGDAVPSLKNASKFFLNFVSWARTNAVPYLYFAALDESWKAAYEGPQGACWGVFDKYGVMKPGMEKVFEGRRVADNWSGLRVVGGPGTPSIEFTFVPKYNTFRDLKGKVRHVAPAGHRVAVYIRVGGGWWTKPYFASPVIEIWPDGTWTCDITTGGIDQLATEIAAFLIPASYTPPLVGGASTLPAELDAHAVAQTEVTRTP
jgi:exo-beta-1,3-glucanase (GH17 family)